MVYFRFKNVGNTCELRQNLTLGGTRLFSEYIYSKGNITLKYFLLCMDSETASFPRINLLVFSTLFKDLFINIAPQHLIANFKNKHF